MIIDKINKAIFNKAIFNKTNKAIFNKINNINKISKTI